MQDVQRPNLGDVPLDFAGKFVLPVVCEVLYNTEYYVWRCLMSELSSLVSAVRNSRMLRLCIVGFLVIILLLPVTMIRGLVAEREGRNREATAEVSSKWGNAQIITGPALVLPYTVQRKETTGTVETLRTEARTAMFLPKALHIKSEIAAESRTRGIFTVPVYGLRVVMEGRFAAPAVSELGIDPATVAWDRAHLVVGIADVRGIQTQSNVTWNGRPFDFLPGSGGFVDGGTGVHAAVAVAPSDKSFEFAFPLVLNGSVAAYFVPFGEDTLVELKSNYLHPSFQGSWLPITRAINDNGFNAVWRISYLGRNYPQAWISGSDVRKAIDASRFGVELADPVDRYRMADRSVKYAGLFILLTFATIWLVEVLANARVHPVQYLLLGAALCVFYLLELSLSEHIPFGVAYGIASSAILAMIAAYSRVIVAGAYRLVVPAGVGLLYSYLFVLLTNEDGALLVGSIGLFVILAAAMFLTRRVQWYAAVSNER
jgi:inner membrane protein